MWSSQGELVLSKTHAQAPGYRSRSPWGGKAVAYDLGRGVDFQGSSSVAAACKQ